MTRSATKQALLDRWKQGRAAGAAPPATVPRRSDAREIRLSFPQERLWFLDRFDEGRTAYNICAAFRITGELDSARFSEALNKIVRRHEVLRTTFREIDGTPLQSIAAELTLPLPVVDLQDVPSPEHGLRLDQIRRSEAARRFDLTRGPLLRMVLARCASNEHVLLLTRHHIVADAWSLALFIDELVAHYEAGSSGAAASLDDLPIQYADYAVWQRNRPDTDLAEQIAYWMRQLQGAPRVLDLPFDRPMAGRHGSPGALVRFAVPAALADRLTSLGRDENATNFMTLLAAFQVLLARYCASDDVVVGCPIANRNRREVEGLIGVFANTVVMRGDLTGDPSFRVMLRRVRETCLAAYAHQDVPFERLVELLQPQRDKGRSPLFQAMFVLQHATRETRNLHNLSIELLDIDTAVAMFDLTLALTETQGRWHGAVEYNTDLFAADTMTRLARQYVRLLEAAVGEPDRPMSTWAWLDPAERSAVLATAGATVRVARPTETIPELFDAQVARTPEAIAVSTAEQSLSYAALQRAANQVAQVLRARGVGPEVRVAVCLERSVDLVVAVLGVLKAGAAYVPIDPATPPARLAWMVADTGAPLLVSQATLRAHVAGAGVPVVELPLTAAAGGEAALGTGADRAPAIEPDHLAYVIYTSGSTGTPKGVLVTHANVVRLFSAAQDRFQFDHHDVWTVFHSAAFDFSVWELWGALLNGGRAVVVSRDVQRSPDAFYRLLLSEGVTVLNQTPSAFRQLARIATASPTSDSLALRSVIFGGEALDVSQLEAWFERFGDGRPGLVNMYGITETTVHVTYRALTRRDLDNHWVSPIGQPLPDLCAFILDRQMQPVPRDVPGELYVGGSGVARGYLGRSDLTAERFVPDPYSAEPGGRLYRTGDRARLRSDGEMEYLGRADHQIKVRGFRIESGEIEAALSLHPAVRECVVVGRPDDHGVTQLTSYVVPSSSEPPRTDRFRDWLSARLPDYMVPSVFVFLEVLPRTSGGKVDRKALPPPRGDRPDLDSEYVAPKGALEQQIAMLWAGVLQLDKVGVRDNFFSLGGNSLRLAQLHGLLQERLALDAPMVTLFKYPTVRSFADYLQANSREPTSVQQGHARAKARHDSLGQRRLEDGHRRRAGHSDSDRLPD